MIGEQILNYQIQAKIGEGGMGSVYLAVHNQLNRRAAIKALHPTYVNNLQIRERFKNEAATMAHLRHPNIVSLYDYLETNNGLYLIMEFVEGSPLDDYISNTTGPVPEARAVSLFIKVLDGFEYAHNQGVIHRDIKPSNLIVAPGDDIKILDFGIAKLLDGNNKGLTKTGSRMGTVLYMSPEQVMGQHVDQRSDIYALGITLFQMLTGRSPYDEINSTEYEIYNQIVNERLPRASSFYPTVSDRIQAIIDKATAKSPQDRYQNCQEFRTALLGGSALTNSYPNTQFQNTVITSSRVEAPKNQNTLILASIIITLLLSAFSLVVIFNPFNISAFKQYEVLSSHSIDVSSDKLELLKEKLSEFFEAEETHDFELIKPFYNEIIEVYYDKINLNLDHDIRSAKRYYWNNNAQEENFEIDWESLNYHIDESGNHIVLIDVDLTFVHDGQEDVTIKKFEIHFNSDWKIYYFKEV